MDDKYRLRSLPIEEGEHLLYGDLNIPKEVTDKYAALGQIIYEDGLKYFLNAKKYGKVDGTVSVWIKAELGLLRQPILSIIIFTKELFLQKNCF